MVDHAAGTSSQRLQEAVGFFQQAVWTRVMSALYAKYIEQGRVGGRIVLAQGTTDEQRAVARFLGKPLSTAPDIIVRLPDFQRALQNSFGCELSLLLQALFPHYAHVTRPQQKELRVRSQQAFEQKLSALVESLPSDSLARAWLTEGRHGRALLFRQHKNEPAEVQEQLLHMLEVVIAALDSLPTPPSFLSLSHFALQVSGDPHFFDSNTAGGRLFLSALTDLRELSSSQTSANTEVEAQNEQDMYEIQQDEQDHGRHVLYYEAGLLLDTISSTVAVFHLKQARERNGQLDPLLVYAGERILVLPLRQLLLWENLWPVSSRVYVFENPQVFEVIVDRLLQRQSTAIAMKQAQVPALPTMICTAGWPSVAAIRLLSLLVESSPQVQLCYSGDFDLQGLRIARYMLAHYPRHCHAWRFDPESYRIALHQRGAVLGCDEIAGLRNLPEVFSPLVHVMEQEQKKAYHEGITERLLEDICEHEGW